MTPFTHADEPRLPRGAGLMRAMAVTVAALLTANGVIVAENMTGWDIEDVVKDGFGNAREALARALDPDAGPQVAAGPGEESSTTTTAAPAATPAPDGTTATSGPAAAPTELPAGEGTPSTAQPAKTSEPGKKPGSGTATTVPAAAAPGVQAPAGPAAPAASGPEGTLAALRSFVERERGLTFKSTPKVTQLDENAFKSRLASYRLKPKTDAARRVEGPMKALGLIAPDTDLVAQMNRLSTGSAPAFYDASANELFVRADIEAPFTRKILAHELTQALNDQHFELHRPELRNADDETAQAFEALYEGIASDIEERYVKSLNEGDRKSVEGEQQKLAAAFPRDLPQYVLINFGFPYTAGKRFAASLFGAGGAARLNEALQRPPATTEQILRPEKYGAGEAALAVATPQADGPVVTQGVLGQLTLALMLAEVIDGGVAEAAADGWGADRWVSWQNGGQTCVRLAIVMDNPEHAGELGEALTEWAAGRPGAVVEGTGPFTVTRCA